MPKLRYDYGILPRYCAAFLEGLASATPDPATVIEIGTYEGNSLVALLRGLAHHEEAHIWSIDLSDRVEADDLVRRAGLSADRYTRIVRDSAGVAAEWDRGPVDLVYVDGDHSQEGVESDIEVWGPHVKPGGLMVFDDYQTPNYHGSTQAIQARMFRSNQWHKVGQVGRCIAFERLDGVADWQRDIGAWKTFWPTEIDWHSEPLGEEAWRWVNYGWQWNGYPALGVSQHDVLAALERREMDLEELRKKSTEDMTPEEIDMLPAHDKAIRGLLYDASIYDHNWFHSQGWQHPWCDRLMGWLAGEYGPFASSLDLGAGDGYYSQVLAEMGAEAVAVEVSAEALEVFGEGVRGMVHDLREPLDLDRGFDLVVCLEVAEHLPLESADVLCDTIVRHCEGQLLFTAAPPGQGGHGHCNLQPFGFWASRLRSRGLALDEGATDHIADAWARILGEHLPWLSKNISLFRRVE